MKRRTILLAVVGLLLIGGTGFLSYTRGVEAGKAQANDIRSTFFASRGIAGGAGGAGGFAGGNGGAAGGFPGAAGGNGGGATGGFPNAGGAPAAAASASPEAGGAAAAGNGAGRRGQAGQGGAAAGAPGGGGAGFFGGAPAAFGQITAVDGDSLTLTGRDGNPVTVKLDGNTAVMRQARTDKSALKDGLNVTVVGETQADGSVAARSVMILGAPGQGETAMIQPETGR